MPIEIIPHLWLGDHNDAEYVSVDTRVVVNCTKNIPFYSQDTINIRIAIDDIPDDAYELLDAWVNTDLFDTMSDHILQKHNVLVHCQMGRQRSASTIAAFLMKTASMSKDESIAFIKRKKREAFFPYANFDKALAVCELKCNKNRG
jgi:predicted protein tyrosine phosphatase